jgi:hypothetical protein
MIIIIINYYKILAKTLDKIDSLIKVINQLTTWWIS